MNEVDKKVESICQEGCKYVNKIRTLINEGETVAELSSFSETDIKLIKKNLDGIMKPYENKKKFGLV